jgi:hypothetical protein
MPHSREGSNSSLINFGGLFGLREEGLGVLYGVQDDGQGARYLHRLHLGHQLDASQEAAWSRLHGSCQRSLPVPGFDVRDLQTTMGSEAT